ncbi:PTS system fructose IIA component [Clostridiales bacterium 1_7_47FAA]|uniref:PTS sugar transporter subunit IIA n=1 Tax=Enterocloster hominis (ex Hitch et al. 2024) TaxID=1917870 RepID=UPI0001979FD1|nr:hypothetical protein [Lachnoclostridium pacaense]EEQ59432.1 PTS system fructose IIA component [Clostridiales bacterium 1_7_47FAA]MCC2819589.1 hypothetical protein [Lachnoclostridium pacaense]
MEQQTPVILVISHGFFCRELVNSVKMIFGDAPGLLSLPLEEGMDPEVYEEQLNQLIDSYDGNVFVCVDIMGGTPFKSLAKAARTRTLYGVAGVSMPMLIEVLSNRDELSGRELAAQAAAACSEMVMDLTEYMEKMHKLGTGE